MQEIIAIVQVCCLVGGLGIILVALLVALRILTIVRVNEAKFNAIVESIHQAREPILASLRHAEDILADSKVIAEQAKQATIVINQKIEKIDIDAINDLTAQAQTLANYVRYINTAVGDTVIPPITRFAKLSRALQRAIDAFLQRIS